MPQPKATNQWPIYQGLRQPHAIEIMPEAPRWRQFGGEPLKLEPPAAKDPHYIHSGEQEINLVNAALYLRRPLLVTGKPGSGKSSLARAIAYELELGRVLYWPITSRSILQDGLYTYDAIGRLQEAQLMQMEGKKQVPDIGKYIRLGPLGTALLPTDRPRVLLIDEIDKSDLDLPNALLFIFEECSYEIPELARLEPQNEEGAAEEKITKPVRVRSHDENIWVPIYKGRVTCREFPLVVLTSNGEKEFPPAFMRRCLQMELPQPDKNRLIDIVKTQLDIVPGKIQNDLIAEFLKQRDQIGAELATDQLMNVLHLLSKDVQVQENEDLRIALLKSLVKASER